VADNYPSFLSSRIVGALGMAPYEVLVQATISDLYFVHERATRIAVWNLFLLCGICGAGFISGYIIENLGYEWTFGVCAILFGVFGFGILFFVPETNYIRNQVTSEALVKTGIQDQERGAENEKTNEKGMHVEYKEVPRTVTGNGSHPDANSEAKMSYMKSLRLYTGRYTDGSIWKIFARPFVSVAIMLQDNGNH
jgi:MFS family permease